MAGRGHFPFRNGGGRERRKPYRCVVDDFADPQHIWPGHRRIKNCARYSRTHDGGARPAAPRGHRAVFRRSHHQQRSQWHRHVVEPCGGACVRLFRQGDGRPVDYRDHSSLAAGRREICPRPDPRRTLGRALRNGSPDQGRRAHRHLAHGVAHPQRSGQADWRIEDRARHPRAEAVRHGGTPAWCNRGVVRRCHCQQGFEWHRHVVERRRRADVRLHGRRDDRTIDHPRHSAGAAQ